MIFVFYIFAALLIWTSWLSLRGGLEFLRFFRSETAKAHPEYTPFTSVIVPCKGLDQGLDENLAALLRFDHPAYEVLFVVDDERDPAAAVIKDVAENFRNSKLIVAGIAENSSQKIANLLEAVRNISDRTEIIAFVDSDARPSADWLRRLSAPLEDKKVGTATGYRWFISPRPTFASELRSVWNASAASVLGPNVERNFCWGGSMALRRETFEQLKIDEYWAGALSDDLAVTRAVNDAGLEIRFVPQALTASVEECTFGEMLEFTTRQMKITRVYRPELWLITFFGSVHFCSVMIAALAIAVFSPRNDLSVLAAITTLVLISALSTAKAVVRLRAVSLVLDEYSRQLQQQKWTQYTLWLITPAIFLFNCAAALFSRKVRWRGTVYKMVSPNDTRTIGK